MKPLTSQLHSFSEKAYAAVIYLCQVYVDGSVDLCLVNSKTRVTPMKS